MAALQAYGDELGRIASLLKTKAYTSDGVVLVNHKQGALNQAHPVCF